LSIDPVPSLKGWADFLGGVPFPLLSDFWPHGAVGKAYGIFNEERGMDKRAAYVVDAQGIVRYAKVYPQGTIPTSDELLAELRKL
jgi:alkyl hydroperoxide reductase subunit AhpC